ncbi:MAG: hypothetical protein ACRDFX_06510, partial [Chloroflexota bacterium]
MLPAVAMILLLQMQASGGVVKASGSMSPARSLVTRYFENLKGHRYHAAYLLEATCPVTWKVHNASGPPGAASLAGRKRYGGIPDKSALRTFEITGIRRFHAPLLTRLHFLGFHVKGLFQFVAPPESSGNRTTASHAIYHHTLAIELRRCGDRLAVDPNWLQGGGGTLGWA